MLEHLDDVPWAEFEHAYGPATDVPVLLRKLLSADGKIRGEALRTLYNKVFHQSTRYPVTPRVVPFLIELCASTTTPDRRHLLSFWGNARASASLSSCSRACSWRRQSRCTG